MIDSAQLFLAFIILVLVVIVSVISVQVYFILKEFRTTIAKMNKVLDDTGVISESVSKPLNMLSGTLLGLKGGSEVMKLFTRRNHNERE